MTSNVIIPLGQPVVWALADKEDADTLECLWAVIKRRCPNATVTTLMTDDGIFLNFSAITLHTHSLH